jgi:hypothetical protein
VRRGEKVRIRFRQSEVLKPIQPHQVARTMDQDINQPIDVIVVFRKGQMVPVRFRWGGRVVKIARVTGWWKTEEGTFKVKHFSIVDRDSQFCQLSYKERTAEWFLEKIWLE